MNKIVYKSAEGRLFRRSYSDKVSLRDKQILQLDNIPKDEQYLLLHKAFEEHIIPILYDKNITSIKPKVEALTFEKLPMGTSVIFFTSGTTGEPTGALKSRENITKELNVLKELFSPLGIERVIVTVPLIHIYGFLAGVLLPRALGAEVILKEEFLPHELIELAEDKKSLCITNPVFLKVLNKLNITQKYPNITFLSSTGKLDANISKSLYEKLEVTIYQLFGSTETGGIAYKINDDELWKPLNGVTVDKVGENLSVDSPYISDFLIEEQLVKVDKPFVTTDIIEIKDKRFKLLGRDSEIIKISGKRISILEIETLLEQSSYIEEALVKLAYDVDSYKDEQLEILVVSAIQATIEMTQLKKVIKKILQENYQKINIRFGLKRVETIAKNHMGKKLRR